jgi:phage shock protein B
MELVFILAIIFGGSILALIVIGVILLLTVKILKGGFSRKSQQAQVDEARVIQTIYKGMTRLEERVEALETIIKEHEGKGRSK